MYIFAHVFAGALLGLIFWHLLDDRRAIPLCIAGSILPDLVDKPLGLLFPAVLGGGRTIFHSLGIVLIIFIVTLLVFQSNNRLLGIGVAGAVLLHQVFDEMWTLPANWFYPLFGPFQGMMIPDYLSTYFWFEITNPSEWLFMIGSVMILMQSNPDIKQIPLSSLSCRTKISACTFVVISWGIIGLYLVAAGLISPAGTFITPLYNQVTNVMAGLLLLIGAVIIFREKDDAR
jgi:hypothetical protein